MPSPLWNRPLVVALAGSVNAGKSTLLNAWCGHQRAIVSDQAGTTRDVVSAEVIVQGWSTRVLDVAGERDDAEVLEREGQDLARAQQAQADVVLRLVPPEVDVHQAQAAAADNEIVIASHADRRADEPTESAKSAGLRWAGPQFVGEAQAAQLLEAMELAIIQRCGLPLITAGRWPVTGRQSTHHLACSVSAPHCAPSERTPVWLVCRGAVSKGIQMIDVHAFRADPAAFEAAWSRRGMTVDVAALVELDKQVRELKTSAENKKSEANAASKEIGKAAREGKDVGAAKAAAKALSDEAKAFDAERQQVEQTFQEKLLELPNPCLPCVPDGFTENENVPLDGWGEKPAYDFTPKPHWELAADLGIIDFERGARLSGSGFVAYTGLGARYVRALTTFFLK